MNQTIFLDRDGVINKDSPDYIKSPDEWQPIPGSLEAIAKLSKAGFPIFIITNQSGVGRGLYSLETLEAIHQEMLSAIEAKGGKIKAIYFCPHHPDKNCECRKPKPGLLFQAAKEHEIDLTNSLVIGDSLRDIEAGLAAKAKTLLVMTGNGNKTASTNKKALANTLLAEDLASATQFIIAQSL